ncbi:MAG: leucyl aminopeptidase [Asgard group archaeon]|nr:leucyl aminopeptidase [Asgard group archaeon]
MKLAVQKIASDKIDTPCLVVGVTEEAKDDPLVGKDAGALGKLVKDIIDLEDFKGKSKDVKIIYSRGAIPAKRVLLVGLGKEEDLTLEKVRKAIGVASRKARDLNVKKVAISVDYFMRKDFNVKDVAEALTQGIIMGSFQLLKYRTKDLDKYKHIEELQLISAKIDDKELKPALDSGGIIAKAVNLCRELAWGPANDITPTKLAEEAIRIGKDYGIKTTVFDREKCYEIGLHSFMAVAQGTEEPPKFIIMEYGNDLKDVDTVALIGKGITFDTGGISIKPSSGMESMKADMTGGAVVIAIMDAIAQLKPNVKVVGIVPATDNMPSGKAYKPGDVVKSYSGQTIEVISTDAEGRMIINDALTYAARNYKPVAMVDFATLTGSMYVALGHHALGFFANDDDLAAKIQEASDISGEPVWRMPLWDVYDKQIESDVADFKHTGGRPGGAITAARFLSKFVDDLPWVHMDIAGYSSSESEEGYNPKGSKGPAVRLIVDLIRNWKK